MKTLKKTEIKSIINATRQILKKSISVGGTTLQNHLQPSGKLGYFFQELEVYGKKNKNFQMKAKKIKDLLIGSNNLGKVREINVDVGEIVKNRQLLAELESAEVLASLAEAKANLLMAKNMFERSLTLDETNHVSQQRLENEEFKFQIA